MEIKFKHTKLTTRGVVARLLNYYHNSSEENKRSGLKWYNDAHQFAIEVANRTDIPVFRVCGVIAALSPMSSWDVNRDNTIKFLVDKKDSVHTGAQVAKAHDCLHAESPREIFNLLTKGGVKTSHFFWNILYPDQTHGVTIDRHAIGSSVFPLSKAIVLPDGYGKLTPNQYKFLVNAHQKAAEKLGIMPHQLQATIWATYREQRQLFEHKEEIEVPF